MLQNRESIFQERDKEFDTELSFVVPVLNTSSTTWSHLTSLFSFTCQFYLLWEGLQIALFGPHFWRHSQGSENMGRLAPYILLKLWPQEHWLPIRLEKNDTKLQTSISARTILLIWILQLWRLLTPLGHGTPRQTPPLGCLWQNIWGWCCWVGRDKMRIRTFAFGACHRCFFFS